MGGGKPARKRKGLSAAKKSKKKRTAEYKRNTPRGLARTAGRVHLQPPTAREEEAPAMVPPEPLPAVTETKEEELRFKAELANWRVLANGGTLEVAPRSGP